MANNTHINVYIQEMEDAYKEASSALATFYEKVQNLKGRFATHVVDVAQAVGQSVPEVEALVASDVAKAAQAAPTEETQEDNTKAKK